MVHDIFGDPIPEPPRQQMIPSRNDNHLGLEGSGLFDDCRSCGLAVENQFWLPRKALGFQPFFRTEEFSPGLIPLRERARQPAAARRIHVGKRQHSQQVA